MASLKCWDSMGRAAQLVPTHELDLSDCDMVTPSYRRRPAIPHLVGHKDSHNRESDILNDKYVSWVIPWDVPSPKYRYTTEEASMFKLEDTRYKLNLKEEHLKFTRNKIQDIIKEIGEGSIRGDISFSLKEHLPVYSIKLLQDLKDLKSVEGNTRWLLECILCSLDKKLPRQNKRATLPQHEDVATQEGNQSRRRRKPSRFKDYDM